MNSVISDYEKILENAFEWVQGRANRIRPGEPAFALISTLLIIAVLTIMVVAFMQSMRIDRITARSYLNKYRADLAVESGKYSAESALNLLTTNDSYIVVVNGNYTYIGETTNVANNLIKFIPLFSTSTNATNLLFTTNVVQTGTNSVPNLEPATGTNTATIKSFADTSRTVRATWVYLVDGDNQKVARFAYWAEDLNGKVNGAIAGNTNASAQHTRSTGTNVDEIALYSLFTTNAAQTNNVPISLGIITNRSSIQLSPKTYLAAYPSITNLSNFKQIMDSMTVSQKLTSELETIPYGMGYPDQGRPKYNINSYVKNQNVDALAGVITTNLPNFALRKGALADNYNKTIAANIIKYADTNSTPLVGGDFRSVASTPFVNVFHDKHVWTGTTSSGGSFFAQVQQNVFVQVWNPSNRTINGSFRLEFENGDTLVVGFNTTTFTVAGGDFNYPAQNVILGPNEIKILEFSKTLSFPAGSASPTGSLSRNPGPTGTTFRTYWNDKLVDRTLGKMERSAGQTLAMNAPKITGGLPGLRMSPYTATKSDQPLGDPRATYYLTSQVLQQSYEDRTSWWGMAVMRPEAGHYKTDPTTWIDASPWSGSSYPVPSASTSITLSTSIGTLNSYKGNLGTNTNKPAEAPFYFSTNGMYRSVTEMGNVYDPGQWKWSGSYPASSIPTVAIANGAYGGGTTLRIGRPEHPKFDVAGQRAYQLLDLFAVDPDNASTNSLIKPQMTYGKINLNTATTNALTALISGIRLEKDEATGPKDVPPELIAGFVNAVVARRVQKPFLATSEMNVLTNSNGAIFGNRSQWTSTAPPAATFKDVALEELFSKVYDLTTVRSRTFRVVVVGQALDKNGKSTATARKEYYISLEPVRDPATGEVLNQKCSIFYEAEF